MKTTGPTVQQKMIKKYLDRLASDADPKGDFQRGYQSCMAEYSKQIAIGSAILNLVGDYFSIYRHEN